MKPICVPCERFMRAKNTGFYFLEGMPKAYPVLPGKREPGLWAPYKLWAGAALAARAARAALGRPRCPRRSMGTRLSGGAGGDLPMSYGGLLGYTTTEDGDILEECGCVDIESGRASRWCKRCDGSGLIEVATEPVSLDDIEIEMMEEVDAQTSDLGTSASGIRS